jgi:hypothetical protein
MIISHIFIRHSVFAEGKFAGKSYRGEQVFIPGVKAVLV